MKKINKWEIYHANLGPVIGSEQGKSRHVLIFSESDINNLINTVNVLPLTSHKPNRNIYPNEVLINAGFFGLKNQSIVLCQQVITLDKIRLGSKYGEITDQAIQSQITKAFCFQMGIDI
jgi:mRNA interferase MazF